MHYLRLILIPFSILLSAPVLAEKYPWSVELECEFDDYNPRGLFPTMSKTLEDIELTHRITNGLNQRNESWNYHKKDFSHKGISYSAAVDISIRCLDDEQIKYLLGELALRGFASWLRRKNEDGWNSSDHIHAVWVYAKLKPQLYNQVNNWLLGRNGLASDLEYQFWSPNAVQKLAITIAFLQANSS